MSKKVIRLKDEEGNYLYPLAHKDSDGNVIKQTYLRRSQNQVIVKDIKRFYAKNFDPDMAPADSEFLETPPEWEPGCYIWEALQTTYLNGSTDFSKPINLTLMLVGRLEI